ncbi:MAG: chloride channel protein [Candidatus Helarchaeota archaeon]
MTIETFRGHIKFNKAKSMLKWIILASVIGFIIALLAIIFEVILIYITTWVNTLTIWLILIVPIIGLLISGVITSYFAPEARGAGTDAIIHAYHSNWGIVKPRVTFAKFTTSLAVLGFGGSAGKEGPTIQMGGGISSYMGTLFNLTLNERRILVLCGMSASFGAIFGAPLSGALFACEVVYRDEFEYVNILPCAISSVIGFLTYQTFFSLLFGSVKRIIQVPTIEYQFNWEHIIIFLVIGFICGIVGLLFVKFFYHVSDRVKASRRPDWHKTGLGGVVVILLGILFMGLAIGFTGNSENSILILGLGWNVINMLGADPLIFSVQFLVILLIFKILTTIATVGPGGSGGIIAPTLVLGALVGGIIAILCKPFLGFDLRVIIVVASIVMFASIAHIPLTGMLLGGEIYGLSFIIPTLLGSVIGSWVAADDSLFHRSLVSRSEMLKIRKQYKIVK